MNRKSAIKAWSTLLLPLPLWCLSAKAADDVPQPPLVLSQIPAEDARFEHLIEWVKLVLDRHPELRQAEAESRQAELRVKEAQAARWPQTSLTGNRGRESQYKGVTGTTTDYNQQRQVQLRGVVPLIDKGMDAQIRQREALSVGADWSLTDVREQLITRTVELYVEVLRNVRMTELARQNLKTHRAYVAQMKDIARIDLGRASDLPMAQSRVALAESVLISRLARLESARVQWTLLTGLPSPDLMTGTNNPVGLKELPVVQLPSTVDLAVAQAIENSPQLQRSLADITAARAAATGAQAAYYPKVNAEARVAKGRDYGGIPGDQSSHYVGLGVDWPLPINPSFNYAYRAAEESVVAATHVRESLTLKVKASVQAQWYELLASQSSLKTFTEYVNSAEQVVQAYSEQFKIGRRSLLDVLNAENELFTARSNVASVEQDVVLASWRLLGLRGLSRQELGL